MNKTIVCKQCNGTKKQMGMGFMLIDCKGCHGLGSIKGNLDDSEEGKKKRPFKKKKKKNKNHIVNPLMRQGVTLDNIRNAITSSNTLEICDKLGESLSII